MILALHDLAALVEGQLEGDGQTRITGAAIARDVKSGNITLAETPHLLAKVRDTSAAAVVVPDGVDVEGLPAITVPHVHDAFAKIVAHFQPRHGHNRTGISTAAQIAATAELGPGVVVHPGATIGEFVQIGANSEIYPGVRILERCRLGRAVRIYPNAVLYEDTTVGDRVLIHAGAVIGAYGFGYETVQGRHRRSAQLGNVAIGDDVEIGAGTTIDRGTYGATSIGEGTKIDNLVMIAHNCVIGRHNLICSQVGIAGSCTTGDYVVMAGQVGLRDHLHIGTQAMLGAKAGVMADIPDKGAYVGIPATPEREQLQKQAALARLPQMRKEFRALQKQVAELAAQLEGSRRSEAA